MARSFLDNWIFRKAGQSASVQNELYRTVVQKSILCYFENAESKNHYCPTAYTAASKALTNCAAIYQRKSRARFSGTQRNLFRQGGCPLKESVYKRYEELPLFLNAQTVAKVLGVSPSSGYELIHEKGFPALRIGSRIVVPKEKFIAWVEANTGGGE